MEHPSRHLRARRAPAPLRTRAGRLRPVASLALAILLGGVAASCAVYDDTWTGGCILDCGPGPSGGGCAAPGDCSTNETCGGDGECHPGNCSYWGCVDGYACVITERSTAECVAGDGTAASTTSGTGGSGGAGGGGAEGGGGDASSTSGAGGEAARYCGAPADCDGGSTCGVDGTCQRGTCEDVACIFGFVCDGGACVRQNAAGCGADADCTGAAERCVDGVCTAASDLCFDGVQCVAGSSCADGKCVPSCAGGAPCPDDFLCDDVRGTCTIPATPCDATVDCGDASHVCVDGACVPRAVDAPSCDDGRVWVDNGCIPDQAARLTCTDEGQQARCANGLVCVHRTCFVPCEAPNQDACAAIPGFETCKDVPAETGTYAVCGADDHLGGACDPTLDVLCADGLVCVDGTCR